MESEFKQALEAGKLLLEIGQLKDELQSERDRILELERRLAVALEALSEVQSRLDVVTYNAPMAEAHEIVAKARAELTKPIIPHKGKEK